MNKIWVVIPAAGKGVRFGSHVPKQYIAVDGQAVLDHVLDAFLKIDMFETILVPVASQDCRFQSLNRAKHHQVASIIGGLKRSDTVLRSLEWLEMHGALQTEWVFVHDAARPLITQGELYALFNAIDIRDCPGAVLGAPTTDALKRVDQVFANSEESEISYCRNNRSNCSLPRDDATSLSTRRFKKRPDVCQGGRVGGE